MIIEMVSLKVVLRTPLLFFLLSTLIILLLRRLGLLSPHAARTPTTERRSESKVDMLLRVETNDEGRDVDNLLADTVE
jgi:hypothetical protein